MFSKAFKDDVLRRLEGIEERLSSDRRAVPVLKDVINILKKENADLKDRLMSKNFQEYKIYKYTGPEEDQEHFANVDGDLKKEDLDDQFAGEVLNFDETQNKMVEP